VILHNLITGTERILASVGPNPLLQPGQVNGDFAVWERCGGGKCNVLRYQISTEATTSIPNPGNFQYAPSVSPSGTMYFIRSGNLCGNPVRLVRRTLGGASEVIAQLPANRDSFDTYVFTTSSNTVFYERFRIKDNCNIPPTSSNIYKVEDAGTVSMTATDFTVDRDTSAERRWSFREAASLAAGAG
jgi:hypothetical protein